MAGTKQTTRDTGSDNGSGEDSSLLKLLDKLYVNGLPQTTPPADSMGAMPVPPEGVMAPQQPAPPPPPAPGAEGPMGLGVPPSGAPMPAPNLGAGPIPPEELDALNAPMPTRRKDDIDEGIDIPKDIGGMY